MKTVTESQFPGAVLLPSQSQPVFVLFSASWCVPCKVLKPLIERLSNELGFSVTEVDAGAEKDLASFYGVRSVPTMAVFKAGKVFALATGGKTEEQVRYFLTQSGVIKHQLEF